MEEGETDEIVTRFTIQIRNNKLLWFDAGSDDLCREIVGKIQYLIKLQD